MVVESVPRREEKKPMGGLDAAPMRAEGFGARREGVGSNYANAASLRRAEFFSRADHRLRVAAGEAIIP